MGDDDGVVVVPLDRAMAVLEAARKKEEHERLVIEEIKKGLLDKFRFAVEFDRLGLEEEED